MGKFELITLPYAANALEPVISEQTIGFHHGKHLQGYVNNLNAAVEGTPFADKDLVEIVKTASGGMLNNAGQILNHNLYFQQFRSPLADNKPTGALAEAIDAQFGSSGSSRRRSCRRAPRCSAPVGCGSPLTLTASW